MVEGCQEGVHRILAGDAFEFQQFVEWVFAQVDAGVACEDREPADHVCVLLGALVFRLRFLQCGAEDGRNSDEELDGFWVAAACCCVCADLSDVVCGLCWVQAADVDC